MAIYTENEAYKELERIKTLSAFNIKNAVQSKKINQYKKVYTFCDDSKLEIYPKRSLGFAYTKNGTCINMQNLKINI